MTLILYQFAGSHFCEKVRWALDYKGLPYRVHNLLIGPHILQTRRLTPQSTVPILRTDDKQIVQGSAEILYYLDRVYPERPLTPTDLTLQTIGWEWEKWLDEVIGIELRRFFYAHLLTDRLLVTEMWCQATPWYGALWYRLMFEPLKQRVIQTLNINANTAVQAQDRLHTAFKRLNTVLAVRPFLVTDQFSRVDLTAAALLSPLCFPSELEFHYPPLVRLPTAIRALHDAVYDMQFFQWVLQIYQQYRITPQSLTSSLREKQQWF